MQFGIRAFSSEVETGSRQENASNQESSTTRQARPSEWRSGTPAGRCRKTTRSKQAGYRQICPMNRLTRKSAQRYERLSACQASPMHRVVKIQPKAQSSQLRRRFNAFSEFGKIPPPDEETGQRN